MLADLAKVEDDLAGDDTFHYASLVASWGLTFYGSERRATSTAIRSLDDER